MKKIQMIDESTRFDCCMRKYRRAIYNSLLELKPKYCFEIGSYIFQTSYMFSQYFKEHQPEGYLITCDVSTWDRNIEPDRVSRVMVYPHVEDIKNNHGGIKIYHENYLDHIDTSLEDNIKLIQTKMDELKIDKFNLAFVDGDHSYTSFFRDLMTAKALVKDDGYLIIDDIEDPNHQQIEGYKDLKSLPFYEYDDICWQPKPGIALIKNSDLIL